ncbi:nuclear transport factor 2 family protein [Pleurocapsales cyanobacterium LEGE 10410]|nr:nuclear transport factor 2 family protein [Pleurocapsales cyanobacterium LEGE 10410]
MTNTSNDLNEYQAIKETVQFYIDGAIVGKSEIMSCAFSEDATIYGFVYPDLTKPKEGTLLSGSIQALFDFVDSTEPVQNLKVEFVRIDLVGTSANVKLELYDWLGMRFIDSLNLLKTDVGWRVVSKVFHQPT